MIQADPLTEAPQIENSSLKFPNFLVLEIILLQIKTSMERCGFSESGPMWLENSRVISFPHLQD